MAALNKVAQKLFGSSGLLADFGEFGSFAGGTPTNTQDPTAIQSLAAFLGGWKSAILGDDNPAIEDMNSLFLLAFYQIAYGFQAGIPEWDAVTEYKIGSLVNVAGKVYVSSVATNVNNAVTDITKWYAYGGKTLSVSTINAVMTDEDIAMVQNGGVAVQVTLPALATVGLNQIKTIKADKGGIGSAANITIKGNGSEQIEVSNTYTMSYDPDFPNQGASIRLMRGSARWHVI